jgi:hypothetical protein
MVGSVVMTGNGAVGGVAGRVAVERVAAMGEDSRGALMSWGFIGVLVCVVGLILLVMYWYIEFKDK